MEVHPFDDAVRLAPLGANLYAGSTSAAYGGFVGQFGGVTAAAALRAVLLHPLRRGTPIALTLHFTAPLRDGAFEVEAVPVRTNRSTQHWTLKVTQAGGLVVFGTAFFGTGRAAWSGAELEVPQAPRPENLAPADGSGREPCVERYEMRFVDGSFPVEWNGEDTGSSLTCLWLRDQPPRPLDFCSLVALADAFFPRIWRRRLRQVPAGTVTMTVHFHASLPVLGRTGSDHLLGRIRAHGFREGYCDQTAHLWNGAGELLLTAHQVAYYRD